MTYRTVIKCNKCGWKSKPFSNEDMKELGVPWYCDACGKRVSSWVGGNISELKEHGYIDK